MKKILCIVLLALVGGVFFVSESPYYVEVIEEEVSALDRVGEDEEVEGKEVVERSYKLDIIDVSEGSYAPTGLKSVLLDLPFHSQAPFADWREPWAEACEEASLVLANRFARGILTLTREEMRDEILRLVGFQQSKYGDYKDSDAARTAEIGAMVYGLRVEVREIMSIEEIKKILQDGKLMIAPMAGRELHNPYFTPPGPLYHMLVIRGFDDAAGEFITSDVGTKRGEAMRYSYETIFHALHDFPGEKERILEGGKKIIIIERSF